jgi:hypothetical protein
MTRRQVRHLVCARACAFEVRPLRCSLATPVMRVEKTFIHDDCNNFCFENRKEPYHCPRFAMRSQIFFNTRFASPA